MLTERKVYKGKYRTDAFFGTDRDFRARSLQKVDGDIIWSYDFKSCIS